MQRYISKIPTVRAGSPSAYIVGVVCVGIAFAVRLIFGLASGQHAYIRNVLSRSNDSDVIGGGRSGLLAMALSGTSAVFIFLPPYGAFSPFPPKSITNLTLFIACASMIIAVSLACRNLIAELRSSQKNLLKEQQKSEMLSRELEHRIRNTGTVMQTILRRTLRADDPNYITLSRRLSALIAGNSAISNAPRQKLQDIVHAEFSPYGHGRLVLDGDGTEVDGELALVASLSLHELVTNAAKHGALSEDQGRVIVHWRSNAADIVFRWIEKNGPEVKPPSKAGFGTTLLRQALSNCGGKIDLNFYKTGLVAELKFPHGRVDGQEGPISLMGFRE